MNVQKPFQISEVTARVLAVVAGAGLWHSAAFATLGGLSTAQNTANDIKTGLYALLGTFAIIYLIYLAIMAFAEKKQWSDFGMGVVWVACAGGTIALGSWAWSLFA